MTRLLTTLILAASLGAPCITVSAAEASFGLAVSAASKKPTSARRQETGQIACTVAGCQRISPNCQPQTGYNWDGIPTGFDVVVCHHHRGRRG